MKGRKKITIALTKSQLDELKVLATLSDTKPSTLAKLAILDWLKQWEVSTNVTTIPIYQISSTEDISSTMV